MFRRTLILTALALVVMASGATGQTWKSHTTAKADGFLVQEITFTPGSIDTANYLDGAAAFVNDSLIFTSPAFAVKQAWTTMSGRAFYQTQDTVSIIDSLGYLLQSKFESPYDSTWWTIATCAKFDEDQMNTVPASADIKAFWDADSIGVGDYFRLQVALVSSVAGSSNWRGEDVSGVIPFNAVYRWYLMFVHKGNQ